MGGLEKTMNWQLLQKAYLGNTLLIWGVALAALIVGYFLILLGFSRFLLKGFEVNLWNLLS